MFQAPSGAPIASAQPFVLRRFEFREQRIERGRIAQPGKRLHDRGPFRRFAGVAQAREQRRHRLVHAGAP